MQHLWTASYMLQTQRLTQYLSPLDTTLTKMRGRRILPNLELARSNRAGSLAQYFCKKAMSTGDGTSTTCPVAVRPPVAASILKTTMLFENWFSASRYLPLGSMAKCRGSLPPVGIPPAGARVRFPGSMERIAMLSFPRLET